MTKLAPAKDWRNRPIETWNVASFTEYLKDKHREMFGIEYKPYGGRWGFEQGKLGDLIGTQSRANPKPRQYPNELVKRFIDETFANYKPTPQYPGTSFGWVWTFRGRDWQRLEAEYRRQKQAEAKREQQAINYEELADWL